MRDQILLNLRASYALRGSFYLQVLFMMLNNLIFFAIWIIFFNRMEEIRGWKLPDMMLLYAVVTSSFGVTMVMGGGLRRLAMLIAQGRLDSFLALPKPILLTTVSSESVPSGWGDICSGVLLFFLSGYLGGWQILSFIFVIFTSSLVLLATGIILSSLSFWLMQVEGFARQWFEYLITISCYPASIFTHPFKIILFTILPAGFVGFLPVQLIRGLELQTLGYVMAGSIFYVSLAHWIFHRGLRHYVSGNTLSLKT